MRHPNYAELVRFNGYEQRPIVRRQLTQDLTLYVATTGSAYGDGSAEKPFGNLQQVFDYLNLIDANGNDLTIYVADGTYTNSTSCVLYGSKGWNTIQIIGNDTNPENVVIRMGSLDIGLGFSGCQWAEMYISGFTFQGQSTNYGFAFRFSGCAGYTALNNESFGGKLVFDNVRSGILVFDHVGDIDCYATQVTVNNGGTLNGYFIYLRNCASFYWGPTTLTIGHNWTLNVYGFAYVSMNARFRWGENTTINGAGAFTGNDYYAYWGSIVEGVYGDALGATRNLRPGSFNTRGGHQLNSYTVAQLPTGKQVTAGTIAYCSNESGGAVLVFHDGTNWRRVTDRAIAS